MVSGVIFGVEHLISAMKANMLGKMVFFGVYVWLFWGSDGAPRWSGVVAMPIPDRFEIG